MIVPVSSQAGANRWPDQLQSTQPAPEFSPDIKDLSATDKGIPTLALAKQLRDNTRGNTRDNTRDNDWFVQARKNIEQREYYFSHNAKGELQAPNRAQRLRVVAQDNGVTIQQRESGNTLLVFGAPGLGREHLGIAPVSDILTENNRLTLNRGVVEEWFINRPDGVEHGYTLKQRPDGKGKLRLALDLGVKSWRINNGDVELTTKGGQRLNYAKLHVEDANGQTLPAQFIDDKGQLALHIDDDNAAYPVTIDPLLTGASDTLLESNQADSWLGYSVSGAGDVNGDGYADVIVGAYQYDNGEADEGAAFVYHGSVSGITATAAALLESNQAGASLGASVAGAGDVNGDGYADVIVGAYRYENGEVNEGAAFVYLGSASGIITAAVVMLESDQANARQGIRVAGAGDVNGDGYADVIVGADRYDNGQSDEGVAFVYHGSASGTQTTAVTMLELNQANARLGNSVAGAGDVNGDGYTDVIVGAYSYDNGEADEGAAFVYHGSASGIQTTATTTLESNQANAVMGTVAGAGDVNGDGYADVIVGASGWDNGQGGSEGAAFVYHGSAGGIGTTAAIMLVGNQLGGNLGSSVAGAGDVNGDGYADVMVGATRYDNGQSDEGVVFVYHGSAGGIEATAATMLEKNQASANLGSGVAGAGDINGDGYADIIVGAYSYDNGESNEGAAFVYLGGAQGLNTTPAQTLDENQAGAQIGFSVADAGDVNGDGYADVIVGANKYDDGENNEGAVFIYHGSSNGISSSAAQILQPDQAGASMGDSVSGAGDVNNDGFADVIVGGSLYDNGQSNEGAAWVHLGSATGINAAPAALLEKDQADSRFGYSVSGAGDINGDGYGDVIVGAKLYDSSGVDNGAAFVFFGNAGGVNPGTATTLNSAQAGSQLGVSVSDAGDVNGDGYADMIVGADKYSAGSTEEGVAYIYYGSSTGVALNLLTLLQNNQASSAFGRSVSGAGDVNGDGYADVIVGAPDYDNGFTNKGAAYVFLGTAAGASTAANASLEIDALYNPNIAYAHFGNSVSDAGDVNGDGYADIIIGSTGIDYTGLPEAGAVFVYHGGSSGISSTASEIIEGNQSNSGFGSSVSGAGDVNGDGYADVILGAWGYESDIAQANEGAAFIHLGNVNGRDMELRPRHYSTTGMLHAWSLTQDDDTRFKLRHRVISSTGKARMRSVVELCPAGPVTVPFGSAECTIKNSTWHQNNNKFTRTVTANSPGLYRWRVRFEYLPWTGTSSGINRPENPPHGPWRYQSGQVSKNLLRIQNTALAPQVSRLDSINDSGDGQIDDNEQIGLSISQLMLEFDRDMDQASVADMANYRLLEEGTTGGFQTTDCSGAVLAGDTDISLGSVVYDVANRTTTLIPGSALGKGSYRLYACSGGISSSYSVGLDGSGDGLPSDYSRSFAILDTDNDGLLNGEDPDDDNDGMPDSWEIDNSTDPLADDANDDLDGDNLTNFQEYQLGSNANSQDTDTDSINDDIDNCLLDINTDQADSDGDGVGDVCDNSDDNMCFPVKLSSGSVAVICL